MNWTKKDIEKLKLDNNLTNKSSQKSIPIKKQKVSVEKNTMATILWVLKNEGVIDGYVEELQFHESRKFRFDWAIPSLKIAIEFEGVMSKKSRHTTVTGYSRDCTKYNEAQKLGWIVLRYTVINYKDFVNDLNEILCKKNGNQLKDLKNITK